MSSPNLDMNDQEDRRANDELEPLAAWPDRPFDRAGLNRRLLPFVAIAAIAILTIVSSLPAEEPRWLLAAGIGTGLVIASAWLIDWRRLPRWTDALPLLAYYPIIGFLRASAGGADSGFGPLVMLPIFWLAMYGTRTHLVAGVGLMTLTFVVPIVLVGDPEYPAAEWRRALIYAGVAAAVGFTTNDLVTRIREAAARSHMASYQDPLTGIGNRRALDSIMGSVFHGAGPGDRRSSVAILDLDLFKDFNDANGHAAGDSLLRACATAWQRSLRPGDHVVRIGGEEFVVILPGCDRDMAVEIVERLRSATPAEATVSAGVAVWAGDGSVAALLERADQALYLAKTTGRDQVRVAD